MGGKLNNHAEHYTALHELLKSWSDLWSRSVFHRFDATERLVPEAWFAYGATAPLADQFALGQGQVLETSSTLAPESLLRWVLDIRRLSAVPELEAVRPLSSVFEQGLTPKKRHEVAAVLALLKAEAKGAASVLDIGGGIGHLARHIALGLECPVDSVDRDSTLQESGREMLRKYPWEKALKHPVRFVTGEFPGVEVGRHDWAVGLHTCGPLAWSQLELSRKGYSLLNVGCCYDKLKVDTDTQRSQHARKSLLPLTSESMFLANRGGVERTADEFAFQQRVQRYRYSLHALLVQEGCLEPHHESVGTAPEPIYTGAFAGYVRDRLKPLDGVPASLHSLSDSALGDFFRSSEAAVEKRRFVAFLRNLLARPLEIALLLDRAVFIQECLGEQVSVRLVQLFDPRISPRNVGILVAKRLRPHMP